ncbi:MFS transporter [Phenylobacterium sp.]|uniref:MFS transporter n=1 Tax=Phenylobacterium sp. TaxID=1871053 RepID=UPI002F42281C
MSDSVPTPPPLGTAVKLTYGLGSVAYGVSAAVLSAAVLQLYFNQVIGLPAVWVGLAIMVSLVADVVIDPMIGHWSDNLRSPWGRRHPFMYASAIPVALFFYLLWHAPKGLDGGALLILAVVMLIAVRVSVAGYEIPSSALSPELAPDYDKRTSLLAYRWFFAISAIAVTQIVLYSVFLRQDASNPLGVLNRARYAEFGALASVVMFICILVSSAATHSRIPYLHRPPVRKTSLGQTIQEILSVFANPALLVLMVANILGGSGIGIIAALQNYFYLHLWGLKPQMIGPLASGGLLASVIGVFLAPFLAQRFGKKRAMLGLLSVSVFAGLLPISGRLLGIMPPNGSNLLYALLFGDVLLTAAMGLMGLVILTSMVADVVEDQQVKTGIRSEGVLFAANGLVPKFTAGLGAFIAGSLISLVGFPVHAVPGTVDPEIVRRLALFYIPCVIVLNGGSVVALSFYKIDRATHERNVARLREVAASKGPGDVATRTPLEPEDRVVNIPAGSSADPEPAQ